METKFVEIRDKGTFVPALAIQLSAADGYLAERAGFGRWPGVYLITLETERAHYDPYSWGDRTFQTAHLWLQKNWREFESGGVVDVEFILGESAAPKRSERVE